MSSETSLVYKASSTITRATLRNLVSNKTKMKPNNNKKSKSKKSSNVDLTLMFSLLVLYKSLKHLKPKLCQQQQKPQLELLAVQSQVFFQRL